MPRPRQQTHLAKLRTAEGLTVRAIAKLCKVSPAAVSQWELMRSKPRTRKLAAYAKILGISERTLRDVYYRHSCKGLK